MLCLIQVAADGELAVIDAMTVGDLTPFWEAVAAPGHETIVHAGRSEVEFCLLAIGRRPAQLFDVQIRRRAGRGGISRRAGHADLEVPRPDAAEARDPHRLAPPPAVSKRQVEYALNDARYLPPLRDTICAKLKELGRLGWLEEEMATWQEGIERSMSHERWRRVSGNAGAGRRADWRSSASCSIGATPRPSAATSRCAAFCATI